MLHFLIQQFGPANYMFEDHYNNARTMVDTASNQASSAPAAPASPPSNPA